MRRPIGFDAPMTHYRLAHLARTRPLARRLGRKALLLEEIWTRVDMRYGGDLRRAAASKLRFWAARLRPGSARGGR
jgi:hypothetical protein